MAMKAIAAEIENFASEWLKSLAAMREAIEAKNWSAADTVPLQGVHEGGNYVNRKGYAHLQQAAILLLKQEKLTFKVKTFSAELVLIKAFFDRLPRAKALGRFSGQAVADVAARELAKVPRENGWYVLPVVFAPQAKATDFQFGLVRMMSKQRFLRENAKRFRAYASADDDHWMSNRLLKDWRSHSKKYDHFILVKLEGYESELGWEMAREIAEFFLNLVRMLFRFSHTDDIRLGGGFIWETSRSSVVITDKDDLSFSSSWGPWGTHLKDDWASHFESILGVFRTNFESYIAWVAKGENETSPVAERMKFASRLLAEAYSEPHEHMRLVRTVSALETLAISDQRDKAHNVSLRCAQLGAWHGPEHACLIYDAIARAYQVRNQIVHGDAPQITAAKKAFLGVEKYLLDIFAGALTLYAELAHENPASIKVMRKQFKARIDWFVYDR